MEEAGGKRSIRIGSHCASASGSGGNQLVTCCGRITVPKVLAEDCKRNVGGSVVEEVVGDLPGEGIGEHSEAAANRGLPVSSEWLISKADTRLIAKHLKAFECLVLAVFDQILIRRVGRWADRRKVAGQPGEAVRKANGVGVMLETHAIGKREVGLHLPLILDVPAHGIQGYWLGGPLRELLNPFVDLTSLE